MSDLSCADSLSRFTFDDCAVRGEHVLLHNSFQELLSVHHYPPVVARLLGELSAAASLLAETIKFDGTLTLQIRSEGEIPLIMAEVTSDHTFRAIARQSQQATSTEFSTLFTNGTLCLTVQPRKGKPYQGVVSLDGNTLATSLATYFEQSEQLATRVWLFADDTRAGGLLLQQMPGENNSEHWLHLTQLANTLSAEELLGLPREELLYRLYHQENLRLHPQKSVKFQCTCSRERLETVLLSLGEDELRDILKEQSNIDVNCEFCNRFYQFTETDVNALLGTQAPRDTH